MVSAASRRVPLPPEDAAERLLRYADTAAEEYDNLVALRDTEAWDRDAMAECGRLVLEYGVRRRALDQEWARWAAARGATHRVGRSAGGTGPRPGTGRRGRHIPQALQVRAAAGPIVARMCFISGWSLCSL
ncbi:hypothetical protein [Streptomyces sp. NPDC001714]|uniref:hypothetical protein n=1 Tax=Streptomyces sp. NPDC001714 TaxID=3364603 RepID=UPI0036B9C74A